MGNGKICLVTGAMGSIGRPVCVELARGGATVVMMCRDEARGRVAVEDVRQRSGGGRVELLVCDLGSLDSVRRAAVEYKARFPRLDLLVNNAAVFTRTRKETSDGHESMLGINYLAHLLLTILLVDLLRASAPSRVVWMTMPSKEPIDVGDLEMRGTWSAMKALVRSKAACTYAAVELAKRLEGSGVTVNAVNPGMVKSTLPKEAALPLRIAFKLFGASPEKGKDAPLYVATSPQIEGVTGTYFDRTKPAPLPKGAGDQAARERLWQESLRLIGPEPRGAVRLAA